MTNDQLPSSFHKDEILYLETTENFGSTSAAGEDRKVPSFPEVIDSTILSTFIDCPLKAFREYCLKLGSPTPSIHLHAGGAFAKALEVVRRGRWEEELSFDECLDKAFIAFTDYWGDFEAPDYGTGANKTYERMWQAVEFYFEQHPIDTDSIRPYIFPDGRTGVEFSFGVPLPVNHPETGNPLIYGGRTDLLGYYKEMPAIIDEKTTTSLGDSWMNKWNIRGQFIGYTWGARQSGIECGMALVRGVSILKTKFGNAEVPLTFADHVIDRWLRNMIFKVTQFKSLYELYTENPEQTAPEEIFPMNFGDACTAYGGCMFKDLCLSPNPEQWYEDFVYRDWNPLAMNPNEFEVGKRAAEDIPTAASLEDF